MTHTGLPGSHYGCSTIITNFNSDAVRFEWSRERGTLPSDAVVRSSVLYIPSFTTEDAGMYVCRASNDGGSVFATARLSTRGECYITTVSFIFTQL